MTFDFATLNELPSMPRFDVRVAVMVLELRVVFSTASASWVVPWRVHESEAVVSATRGVATLTFVPIVSETASVISCVSCAA